jgi:hypothetical protein
MWADVGIYYGAWGSGNSGVVGQGDVALNVTVAKQNWLTNPNTAVLGELDALQIYKRQGGPDGIGANGGRDGSAILVNTANIGTAGFDSVMEGVVSHISRSTFTNDFSSDVNMATYDAVSGNAYGFTVSLLTGNMLAGYYINPPCGGCTLTYAFEYSNLFWVDASGNLMAQGFIAAGNTGVSCAAGTVNAATMVVVKGIVVHC